MDEFTDEQAEERIAQLAQERLVLNVTPALLDQIYRHAEFNKMSVEEYCMDCVFKGLAEKAGKPHIDTPTQLNGRDTVGKITGPSGRQLEVINNDRWVE